MVCGPGTKLSMEPDPTVVSVLPDPGRGVHYGARSRLYGGQAGAPEDDPHRPADTWTWLHSIREGQSSLAVLLGVHAYEHGRRFGIVAADDDGAEPLVPEKALHGYVIGHGRVLHGWGDGSAGLGLGYRPGLPRSARLAGHGHCIGTLNTPARLSHVAIGARQTGAVRPAPRRRTCGAYPRQSGAKPIHRE